MRERERRGMEREREGNVREREKETLGVDINSN